MSPTFQQQPLKGFATVAAHAGIDPKQWKSACLIPPIVMSTTFQHKSPGEYSGFEYSREKNPTRNLLETALASLDNAKYGLTYTSGLSAVTSVLSLLSSGDHVLVGDNIYGGTDSLIRQVATRLGISSTFADAINLKAFEAAIRPNTRLIFVETPSNPLLKIADIRAIAEIKERHGNIIFAVDNTFLTPYFQQPLKLGADLAVYSLTKYMNGHTDVIMGGVTFNSPDIYKRLYFLQHTTGTTASPFDCFLVMRGLRTLALRMEQHQRNSIRIATFLEAHDFVEKVLHPALPTHPQHELAIRQCSGHSGIFAFYIKGNLQHSKAFLKACKVFTLAASLGGVESLIALPTIMTHHEVPVEERLKLGITDSLIRVSVGIEDADDLIADLANALQVAKSLGGVHAAHL